MTALTEWDWPGNIREMDNVLERAAILCAVRAASGVVAGPDGAAVRLGLKRTTLQARMRKLGIQRSSY